ncbi:hypothetical protein [Criblamydia sequanensis]|uniref:Type III secretion chaperone SycD/LcrH n=1 Tax=Candidatus Criblamydia sequanensis CRIB-18 TaxID=1437425 RepID=A0A090CZQ7_9BACT|nr:hypothetical protein [Criblamydia sequanensis]CDR32955.1 Putative type III secretion chaperone SycD/LcrH [Criblamydia sequanensis CRIB-18]
MEEQDPLSEEKAVLTESDIIAELMKTYSENELSETQVKEGVAFLKPLISDAIKNMTEEDIPTKENLEKWIDNTIEKVAETREMSDEEKNNIRKHLSQIFIDGQSLAKALEMEPDFLEWIYGEASRQYYSGRYEEAYGTYRILDMLIPNSPKIIFNAGACLQMMKHTQDAVAWYLRAAYLDKLNPLPYYHLVDCFLKLGDYPAAYGSMHGLLKRTKDIPKYQALERKIKLMWDANKERLLAYIEDLNKKNKKEGGS